MSLSDALNSTGTPGCGLPYWLPTGLAAGLGLESTLDL
jgi:hypothetical protein